MKIFLTYFIKKHDSIFSKTEHYKSQKPISNKTSEPLEEKGISYQQIIKELEKVKDVDFHFSDGRKLSSM